MWLLSVIGIVFTACCKDTATRRCTLPAPIVSVMIKGYLEVRVNIIIHFSFYRQNTRHVEIFLSKLNNYPMTNCNSKTELVQLLKWKFKTYSMKPLGTGKHTTLGYCIILTVFVIIVYRLPDFEQT